MTKLITRDTDYAIRAIAYMAKNNTKLCNVNEMVCEVMIPKPFLRKILQALTKEGILRSYKGIGGGFRLNRNAAAIKITDVMKIFQGPLSLNRCIFKKKICPSRATCMLRKKIGDIERNVAAELGNITIDDII